MSERSTMSQAGEEHILVILQSFVKFSVMTSDRLQFNADDKAQRSIVKSLVAVMSSSSSFFSNTS